MRLQIRRCFLRRDTIISRCHDADWLVFGAGDRSAPCAAPREAPQEVDVLLSSSISLPSSFPLSPSPATLTTDKVLMIPVNSERTMKQQQKDGRSHHNLPTGQSGCKVRGRCCQTPAGQPQDSPPGVPEPPPTTPWDESRVTGSSAGPFPTYRTCLINHVIV